MQTLSRYLCSRFNQRLTLLSIVTVFFSGCDHSSELPPLKEGEVNIEVWQNGRPLNQVDNTFELQKGPFEFRFEFSDKLNLFVSADDQGNLYDQVLRGTPLNEVQGFIVSGLAEGRKNKDRSMTLSNEFPSVWYYSKTEDHRCNQIIRSPNRLTCVRTIENITLLEEDRRKLKIEEYPYSFIYTSFFPYRYESKSRDYTQLDEQSFRLSFRY